MNKSQYPTTTINASMKKVEKMYNEMISIMDNLGYDVKIQFIKRDNSKKHPIKEK